MVVLMFTSTLFELVKEHSPAAACAKLGHFILFIYFFLPTHSYKTTPSVSFPRHQMFSFLSLCMCVCLSVSFLQVERDFEREYDKLQK